MTSLEKVWTYADNMQVKEAIISACNDIKKYIDRAIKVIRTISKIDAIILGAVAASAGAIVGCMFSKACKKLIALFAAVCGLGTAYLIYKKYFKS